ncbi:phosphoglycerate kinase [Rhodovulum sulfidophilum]|uniref:Phosphoglycerate kinase n=1 Tax=Rhodovulum visakhapatnamense TaxID=364297 RepID=A0A4R8G1V4_9RHOB|nr:phosphoglycerate kinase [Rhodovulum visakhapatnamense]MBL3571067.1 phosphoglycerate kinase [Rhodovulum visakhapatnamense]MBL3578903.1 phosphoglycerate kinase [Rhodovulum visakhapatnamense]OLS45560.1 phosphoglycerate kinase [Rhodovulum sulfidophilum]TDX33755.1 phosphoglycerate kinase [Rhodovulum visakhapatnamense]
MAPTPLTSLDVSGRRLAVRADLNVPLGPGGVGDATRIARFARGMKPLLAQGARLVVLSHLGRPEGELTPALSLERVQTALADALEAPVRFIDTCAGPMAERTSLALAPGEVLLCENLRFERGEEVNDPRLGADLARLGDIYVNDAFSCCHRLHASTTAAVDAAQTVAAGPLLLEELAQLDRALDTPLSPSVALVGGRSMAERLGLLKRLVAKIDTILLGGGLANTFLFARGYSVGKSFCEPELADEILEIAALAEVAGCRIVMPRDFVVDGLQHAGQHAYPVPLGGIRPNRRVYDLGPNTVELYRGLLRKARTIVWNGPLGTYETPPFDGATRALAETVAEQTRAGLCVSVAGGGDTLVALNRSGHAHDFTYVSTAGGAFLEWLEGRPLPGLEALERAERAD